MEFEASQDSKTKKLLTPKGQVLPSHVAASCTVLRLVGGSLAFIRPLCEV